MRVASMFRSTFAVAGLLGALSSPVSATVLSDGVLTLDVTSNGLFDEIFLNGAAWDSTTFVQGYTTNNTQGFSGGSAVNVSGTTATYSATATSGIAVNVIIRPRGGDFLFSPEEFAVMAADIETARAEGADGVVIGQLTADGLIDVPRTRLAIDLDKMQAAGRALGWVRRAATSNRPRHASRSGSRCPSPAPSRSAR